MSWHTDRLKAQRIAVAQPKPVVKKKPAKKKATKKKDE